MLLQQHGNFLTAMRDGWMVGLNIYKQPFTGK